MKLSEKLTMHNKMCHFGNEIIGNEKIEQAKELETLLSSLAAELETTYSASPEGRDYLAKIEKALKG